ncbi:MAG: 16S rRNA (cytosine(967)-C(5))-methyltransferase RsmB [Alphaproteobacteria bacterium]|nr:16S rRNA (cytosine(967)-C(5))-methyltransferase RsmB [Alphaproteobacteria bacterium]NCQ88693.1 16S rRNA (cytosine(967)-C(5))-methyltransferase RsmB [Alphaproteobacteria bacterium]NCT08210.1 16S rRNA (cytosine(967)-C(5))-methyltransferase RsmB [Alphaproteobacteria bacterium]
MITPAGEGLESRRIAYEILESVLIQKQPLDHMLESHKAFNSLNTQDRGFARMLISTTLRRKGQLDDLIMRAITQDKPLHPEHLRLLLYIGIVQILFMDVSDHAAVNVTVELAKMLGFERQKGLINAVLRRMTSEGAEWIKRQDPVQANIPPWLLSLWIDSYGLSGAAQIAESCLSEASLDISVKDPKMKLNWAQALEATILPTGSLRRSGGGNVVHLQGFDEGAWWIQDASAALPVTLMGDVQGKTVIDLCAAPGGKTAQLAAAGATVLAVDRAAKRLNILKENMARLGLSSHVQTHVGDGGEWLPKEPVDIVLLDAPCSATGTIRRHPDVMHLKSKRDVEQLCKVQARLLDNAAKMLKSGGMLIYCTCSLQTEEGEDQVGRFLHDHADFKRLPITAPEINDSPLLINEEGELRILPHHLAAHGGMDGFFISRLIKS